MKKGTVKSLAISGLGKNIFRSGQTVTENQFPEGHFQKYVETGHIVEAKEQAEAVTIESETEKAKRALAEREAEIVTKVKEKAKELGVDYPEGSSTEAIVALCTQFLENKDSEARAKVVSEAMELGIEIPEGITTEDLLDEIKAFKEQKEVEDAQNGVNEFFKNGNTKDFVNGEGAVKTVKKPEDINVKQLTKLLKDAEVEFNSIAPKTVLLWKWISLK